MARVSDEPIDPHSELAALVHGLRREVARRRWNGERGPRAELELVPQRRAVEAPAGTAAVASAAVARPVARPVASGAVASAAAATASTPPNLPAAVAARCADLASLRAAVAQCRACTLCETRTQTVFMDGTCSSGVLFVGEAPGEQEDLQGVPFVGRAGQLLTDIITKGMGLERSAVAIANVLKCRPPGNRDPAPEEKELCTPFLERQIELLQPRIAIALGKHAAGFLLRTEASMGQLRGRVHQRIGARGALKVVVTYHPAFLLRTPSAKKDCWQDIQLALREIGLPIPTRGADPDAGSRS
jgi:DNA polymerase